MRALGVILVAMTLALAACGDDSGDQADSSRQGTTGTTASSASGGAGGGRATETTAPGEGGIVETPQEKQSKPYTGPTTLAPTEPVKTGAERYPARERPAYRVAKKICGSKSPRKVGRDYGVNTKNPYKIALAYAKKSAQPSARDAAYVGCLAGLGIE